MSDKCPYQSELPSIAEARCTIPLMLEKGTSWLCEYYHNERLCPIVKKVIDRILKGEDNDRREE